MEEGKLHIQKSDSEEYFILPLDAEAISIVRPDDADLNSTDLKGEKPQFIASWTLISPPPLVA